MYFQIRKIILWPVKPNIEPRILPFELGKINVITGASRTGKSAIIPIIDYCLGSTKCTIPVDIIRNTCSWYGIVIQTQNFQILLARKGPEKDKPSNKMLLIKSEEVTIPYKIADADWDRNQVIDFLNDLTGISSFRIDAEDTNMPSFQSKASFRDFVSFNFQTQGIVANQNILFYKADIYKYREKLLHIFPFALGAVTPEVLAMQYELKLLESELKRKEKEYNQIKETSIRWISEAKSQILYAKEIGLYIGEVSENYNIDDLTILLKQISSQKEIKPTVSLEQIESALKELKKIRENEAKYSKQISQLRYRLTEMNRLKDTLVEYKDITELKRDRLKIADWLLAFCDNNEKCPFCGSNTIEIDDKLKSLEEAFKKYEIESKSYLEIPAAFDREYENVKKEIRKKTDHLNALNKQRRLLEDSSSELKNEHYKYSNAMRFLGKIDQAIEIYDSIKKDGDLTVDIEDLKKKIRDLKFLISDDKIKTKLNNAINKITSFISSVITNLDLEEIYKKYTCRLSIQDLSIKIIKNTNEEYYLSEIGSGSNWLSYHIATTIALHKLFVSQPKNPVPGFIIYDQPSQVYFPIRLADKKDEEELDLDPKLKDQDVEAVKKIFSVLAKANEIDNEKWQVIILDHAAENVWGNIKNVVKIEEWRGEKKLIPSNWI